MGEASQKKERSLTEPRRAPMDTHLSPDAASLRWFQQSDSEAMMQTENLTPTARERQRREIARQTERFLRAGGRIEQLPSGLRPGRAVAPAWWSGRGGEPLAMLR